MLSGLTFFIPVCLFSAEFINASHFRSRNNFKYAAWLVHLSIFAKKITPMLQLNFIRENADLVIDSLKIKNFDASKLVEEILESDNNRRAT
jgi:hypothetical protein